MSIDIFIAIVGSGALAAAISGVVNIILWLLNNKKKANDRSSDVVDGLQVILYDRIKYLGLKYIDQGYVCAADLNDLKRMHEIYHDRLDGNGFLDDVMEQVDDLQIKSRTGC